MTLDTPLALLKSGSDQTHCLTIDCGLAPWRPLNAPSSSAAAMALKRPAAAASPAKSRAKATRQRVAECVREMVPVRRTAYALYLQQQYPIVKGHLQARGVDFGPRPQRSIVKKVGEGWRALSEEDRQFYEMEAKAEFNEQQAAKAVIFHDKPEGTLDKRPALPTIIGPWQLVSPGEELWRCGNAVAHQVQHKELRMRAMSTVFSEEIDFALEKRVLEKLAAESSEKFPYDLFLMAMEMTGATCPVRCIIQELVPNLEEYKQRGESIIGGKLATIAVQVATALTWLHELGFLHLDIRPKSVHFCERSQCAKLARFHRACLINSSEPLQFPPYVGSCRPPECYGRKADFPVGKQTEAWAFGITLIEAAAAQQLFQNMSDVLDFKLSTKALVRYPVLASIPEYVRVVALRFLSVSPEARLGLQEFVDNSESFCRQLANV